MLFCPIQFCPVPMDDEYSSSKKDAFQTPDHLKPKDVVATPETEAVTPGELSTEASSMSSGDSLSSKPETETETPKVQAASPIRPQALQFEEKVETVTTKPEKKASSLGRALKFFVFAIVAALFGVNKQILMDNCQQPSLLVDRAMEGFVSLQKLIQVDKVVVEDAVVEEEPVEDDVDVDVDVDVE